MTVPHPIPYQGSKRQLAAAILRRFPRGVERLLEPFAGSAAVSLAALQHARARRVVLSDTNEPLIALWREIVYAGERLADGYSELWRAQLGQERTFYDTVRDRFNTTHEPADLLYLLARCVKASVRYNANGDFNQSPDNRRLGSHPDLMRRHILRASGLLSGRCELQTADYQDILALATSEDLVYMDPPYQGVSGKRDPRYVNGLSQERFAQALAEANARGLSYLVSYDGSTGDRRYGVPLPSHLGLSHVGLRAGRSSQSTLLGRAEETVESLYVSSALAERIGEGAVRAPGTASQPRLLEVAA